MINLEEMLTEMMKYGEPRLSLYAGGWFCSCEIYVNTKGSTFKISSDFKHATPRGAASQCLERIVNAILNLGVAQNNLKEIKK